jgi:hypothetical protein
MSELPSQQGPFLFENWRAALQGQEILGAYECPLYSDAWIVGQTDIGPYQLINTVAHAGAPTGWHGIAPVVVLRIDVHKEFDHPNMEKTDSSNYHGGTLSDEIAAIAALAMGCRAEAGPTSREFSQGNPRGKPVAYYGFGGPALPHGSAGRTLPWTIGPHSLADLNWLSNGLESSPGDQIALIRAARLYQDAIWIGDAEPALAWLLLVSAIETAAGRWDQSKLSAAERVRYSKPELAEAIETKCPELFRFIAEKIADTMGVTRKFVDFILAFLPPPPEPRPHLAFRVPWEQENLKPIFRKIYGYRSRALHDGIPFPAPMCLPPLGIGRDWAAPAEKPGALAMRALGGVWRQEDTPMSLHIFEYITRRVLQAWWSSLQQPSQVVSP